MYSQHDDDVLRDKVVQLLLDVHKDALPIQVHSIPTFVM